MKRFMISLALLVVLCVIFVILAPTLHAMNLPPKVWRGADMTYSFMQVLNPTSIRIRNILVTASNGTQSFYKEDLALKNGSFTAIPGSLQMEGTNQRVYVIERVANGAITPDASNAEWSGIAPAFLNDTPNVLGDPGVDMKGIYLARDDTFLYIMMTLIGPPPSFDPINTATYTFQARQFPEDDGFSFYTAAQPILDPSNPHTSFLAIHYQYTLTTPDVEPPLTTLIKFYSSSTGWGTSSLADGGYFVEWKVPLTDFPIEALEGRYVDAWAARPTGTPGRIDTTQTLEGVRIVVEP